MQTLLGHSSIKVTMDVYGHLFPGIGGGVRQPTRRRAASRDQGRGAAHFIGTDGGLGETPIVSLAKYAPS